MYLHIGQNTTIKTKSIVGIFDLDNSTKNKTTRSFLYNAEKEGKVKNVSFELPKSFVVCKNQGQNTVFISPISSTTLTKRNKNVI
ncbi:MAG: hypothetical protein RUMPE_00099 [Eubacteriales bacterium SKADARSKE-1]|nr:hypothetical protein [Eubacteriales bacterium SKADARSKE-1]